MNDFNESELVHAAQTASRTPGPSELQGQWIQYEMPSSGGSVLNVPAGEDGVFDPSTMTTLVELSGKERNSTTPDLLQGQYLTLEQAADLFSQGLLTSEGDEVQVISGAAVSTDQNVEPPSVHKQPLVAGQAQLYVDGSGISVAADSAGVAATELDPATGLFYPNSQQESSRLPAIAQPATSVQLVVTTLPSGGIQLQQESISSGGAALLQDPGVQLQRPAQQETAGVMAAVEAPPCDNTATVASAVQAIMTTRDAAVVVQTTAGAGESSDAGRRLSAGDGAPSRHGNLMSELTGLGAIVTGAGTNAGRAPQVADAKSRLTTVTALAQADVVAMPAMSTQLVMGEPAGTSVTVISSGLDTSSMNVEDFTSQRLAETEYFAVSDTKKVGYALPAELISRTRKRKMDEGSQGSVSGGSWVRAAMGLLEKVSRYRGVGRMKGELNAADWFNKPVDLSEAPEYLKIIKTPMDFSTIRNKLKAGQYGNFDEFHADMLLVKTNCQLYNPSDHDARKDCDEVFQFYAQEYNKLMEKWQTSHLMSPSKVPSMSKI
ncbi:PREDICTED: homeotic protein female sterile-like [Priapulus caudatus]|uniref:Homeotic protein female sterile-like n=1 Tax=Priapulus caudatus TaxID=37621 RepID=A0ABM1FAB8_PRICU|nr:PREDICTED: homeotic protein female sterile-like [Priapulus caudatus]